QGMILAFDVADAPPGFARRYFAEALQRELLLRPIGPTVYTLPPYILDDVDIDLLARRTAEALEASLAG
ncbi:MAG TPA: adenosylmethionine--8-amino-7-oxononanoate aminotransferase BioA, partial [Zoogloea sp.]|nr:adenosylmethionine--8-amino-7-oxononanoate aminotransferase BioA [Zoogloea sp.]